MASVTFSPAVGGDGSTVTDDANVSTGLANGGHRTRFVPALAQLVAVAANAVASAAAALASKNNAATSEGNASTSATNAQNSFLAADVKYLGAKASAPTLNNQGGALLTGATYYNTTNGNGYTWTGSAWVLSSFVPTAASGVSSVATGYVSATDVQTAIAQLATRTGMTNVTVAGTTQTGVAFSHYIFTNASACTLTLKATPSDGDVIWVTFENGRTDNTVARNGQTILKAAADFVVDTGEYLTWKFKFANGDWKATL